VILGGCAPKPKPPAAAGDAPSLPSPRGEIYTRAPARPGDALVAGALGDTPWDEALAGAAAGVLLSEIAGVPVDPRGLRWKRILAGYPWPIVAQARAQTAPGEVPAELLERAKTETAAGNDIGLVRARDDGQDRWLLLVGAPRGALPRLAREVKSSERIDLPGVTARVVDPLGVVQVLAAPSLVLDFRGEWLLELTTPEGGVSILPVYAGAGAPAESPIRAPASSLDDDVAVASVIDDLRRWYRQEPVRREPTLDSVARARLRQFQAGEPLPDIQRQLASAGFVQEAGAAGTCRAEDVADCLDRMWWSVDQRAPLVGNFGEIGFATTRAGGSLVVVLVAAG
jgi:hypothetical protein